MGRMRGSTDGRGLRPAPETRTTAGHLRELSVRVRVRVRFRVRSRVRFRAFVGDRVRFSWQQGTGGGSGGEERSPLPESGRPTLQK